MSGPKTLTVVIPVYNTAPWLRRCLDSVLVEDLKEGLEIIAVDDGSTDASPAILRAYQARFPGLLTVLRRENGGHGAALMTGLQAASGRYFRVLDSDDWLDTPGFISYVNQLRGCTEDLIVTPYSQEYTAEGRELRHDYAFLQPGRSYRFDDVAWLEGLDYFCLASASFRTDLLRACGLSLPAHCSYVDMLYALQPVPLVRTLRLLDVPLYRYFIGRAGQSMAPAVLRRQAPMHQRVLALLICWYGEQEAALSPGKRAYLQLVMYYMLHSHAQLLCVDLSGSRESYRALGRLWAELERVPALVETAERVPLLRLSRRLGGWNARLLRPRAVRLLLALRRRLRA